MPHLQTSYIATIGASPPASPVAPTSGLPVPVELVFTTLAGGIGAVGMHLLSEYSKAREARREAAKQQQATELSITEKITEKVITESIDTSQEIHKLIEAFRGEAARTADILTRLVTLVDQGNQATNRKLALVDEKLDRLEVGMQVVGSDLQAAIQGLSEKIHATNVAFTPPPITSEVQNSHRI